MQHILEEFRGRRPSHLEQFTSRSANRNSLSSDVHSTSEGPPVWLIDCASEDYLWRAIQIHSSSSSSWLLSWSFTWSCSNICFTSRWLIRHSYDAFSPFCCILKKYFTQLYPLLFSDLCVVSLSVILYLQQSLEPSVFTCIWLLFQLSCQCRWYCAVNLEVVNRERAWHHICLDYIAKSMECCSC